LQIASRAATRIHAMAVLDGLTQVTDDPDRALLRPALLGLAGQSIDDALNRLDRAAECCAPRGSQGRGPCRSAPGCGVLPGVDRESRNHGLSAESCPRFPVQEHPQAVENKASPGWRPQLVTVLYCTVQVRRGRLLKDASINTPFIGWFPRGLAGLAAHGWKLPICQSGSFP